MTDDELIARLKSRTVGVRVTDLVPIVREYAEDFAAMKLTEAVEDHYRSVIAGVDVVMADDVLRRARALTDHRRIGASEFWTDLNEDMRDPEFRREYEAASGEIRRVQLCGACGGPPGKHYAMCDFTDDSAVR